MNSTSVICMQKMIFVGSLVLASMSLSFRSAIACYMQAPDGRIYDMGHLCISSQGLSQINLGNAFIQSVDSDLQDIEDQRQYYEGRASNAQRQSSRTYSESIGRSRIGRGGGRFYNELSEDWGQLFDNWQALGEIATPDTAPLEAERFSYQQLRNEGANLRMGSTSWDELRQLTREEVDAWAWAIGTSIMMSPSR